jgi:hypothetical protein
MRKHILPHKTKKIPRLIVEAGFLIMTDSLKF